MADIWTSGLTGVDIAAHKARHQDGGLDEIDLTGLTAGTAVVATTSDITTHAALSTGVHGVGTAVIATTSQITTHAALSTGVHGSGTAVIATTSDITTHAALTATHGVSGMIADVSDAIKWGLILGG